ncbi:hypothetical protein MASR2M66_13160 [Chloroflexota bacterium]
MKKLAIGLLVLFVLAACAGKPSASVQGEWELVSYNQTPAASDADTSINFGSDGNLNANVGCNVLNGDYNVDGDAITFGAIASTKMLCQGAVGEQELGTLAVFQGSGNFLIDGNTLTITSADGNSSIVLERK